MMWMKPCCIMGCDNTQNMITCYYFFLACINNTLAQMINIFIKTCSCSKRILLPIWLTRVTDWQSLRLHGHNIPGFALIPKKTIFRLSCLHDKWRWTFHYHSRLHAAVHTPINVMGHHLLEEVGIAVFPHTQNPADIQVFHNAQK